MKRLARNGLLATLAATAATGLGAVLAAAAGVDLDVDGGRIPPTGIAVVTGVFSLAAAVMVPTLARTLRAG